MDIDSVDMSNTRQYLPGESEGRLTLICEQVCHLQHFTFHKKMPLLIHWSLCVCETSGTHTIINIGSQITFRTDLSSMPELQRHPGSQFISSDHHFKIPENVMYCVSQCSMVCRFDEVISVNKLPPPEPFLYQNPESKCPLICSLPFGNLHLIRNQVFC